MRELFQEFSLEKILSFGILVLRQKMLFLDMGFFIVSLFFLPRRRRWEGRPRLGQKEPAEFGCLIDRGWPILAIHDRFDLVHGAGAQSEIPDGTVSSFVDAGRPGSNCYNVFESHPTVTSVFGIDQFLVEKGREVTPLLQCFVQQMINEVATGLDRQNHVFFQDPGRSKGSKAGLW